MPTTTHRTLKELAAEKGRNLSPDYLTKDEESRLADSDTPLTIEKADVRVTQEYGDIYEVVCSTPDGRRFILSFWANPQRDDTMLTLVDLTKEGPVSGVKLVNTGTKAKPFYLLQTI